jgi:hypothetical protein
MAVKLHDSERTLSETLSSYAGSIRGESITLRQLMEMIGEQGLLLFCMFLCVPFLIPMSIPGVSTVFGAVIILIGVGITLNRIPWLPKRLMDRQLATDDLVPTMQKGARWFARFDNLIRPRLLGLTNTAVINRMNGAALTFAAVLLIAPFGLIPFSNTLPALAIVFFAIGMLQRDGVFIILGYVMVIASVIYFGFLFVGAVLAGQGLTQLIGFIPFLTTLI